MTGSFSVEERPAQLVACVNREVPDPLVNEIGRAIQEVHTYLAGCEVEVVGPAYARSAWVPGGSLQVGFPVSAAIDGNGRVAPGELPAGPVATTVHHGPHDRIPATMARLREWCVRQGLVEAGVPWETYLVNPREHPDPADWRNGLFLPVRYCV